MTRRRHLAAEPGTTVVTVVAALGFGAAGATGTGRFSVLYKKRLGESPSETLARAREA
jgi:hypothetical protein